MAVSTSGVEVRSGSRALRETVELVSSMRFAISLLTIICIASVIGTVVKQNEPAINYVNQFGPFWAEVFGAMRLQTVYSAPWFLLILAFLVLSTSLCIARNLPKIVTDWKQYKEDIREKSLVAFAHKGQAAVAENPADALARVSGLLVAQGWHAKVQTRDNGVMIAARKGRPNKIGYLAAHSAIVLVCIGGLLDGDLMVRAQMAMLGKSVFAGGGLIPDVPEQHRLDASNPTFRGNLFVPEGLKAGTAVLNMPGGVVLQDLPFDVELKRFIVEYYPTGMPRLFASEIVVHDRATGEQIEHRVEVNKPAYHRGIAIYQSSFDDGGSAVTLEALPLGPGKPFEVKGTIGGATQLVSTGPNGEEKQTLEFATLRVINVENLGADPATAGAGADVRRVDLVHSIDQRLGAGDKTVTKRELTNIGPSITYRLRDAAGQAREFQNFMSPVVLEGSNLFLFGMRETPQDEFRYLRVPADENGRLDAWLRLRAALDDPALRERAARRYVALAAPADRPEMTEQLLGTTRRVLSLFAGLEPGKLPATEGAKVSGLQALADFLESSVPEADRARVSEVMLRILNGSLFELMNVTREDAGLKALVPGEDAERFMTLAVTSLSDSYFYPSPMIFQLKDFKQVQASVFQVARAPGQTMVYIGCALLIVGVFVMLYVRDRRLWVWLQPESPDPAAPGAARTRITTALSSTRRTLDGDHEFERLKSALLKETAA
jgi:cytochrome c biogenesis protein